MHRPDMRGQGSEQFFSDTPIGNTSMDGKFSSAFWRMFFNIENL
jgi:hypothetical protein